MPHNKGSRLGPVGLWLLLGILLLGGMGVGVVLAKILAPGSAFAQLVGLVMLPLCLAVGMSSWYAAASTHVWNGLAEAMFQAFSGKDFDQAVDDSMRALPFEGEALPGTYVFLPVSLVISLIAGGLVGLTSASVGFLPALGVMALVGLGYGVLLRTLARNCYLPIPGAA
ncbi:MAG: hypothetical protein QNJ30_26390 [Kiloniellales bacterium]|nr:hypothetical protein [Kiloniellales bacterium]